MRLAGIKSAAAATAALLAGFAWADLEQGYQAYQQGDYQAAVAAWRPLAEQGEAVAQFNLGQMYRLGHGVTQDDRQALHWYTLAARQGSTYAQHNIKLLFLDHRISAEDYDAVFGPGSALALQQADAEPPAAIAAAEPTPPPAAEPEPAPEPTTAAAPAPAPEPTPPPAAAEPVTETGSGQDWLSQLDPQAYLVQLLATPNKDSLDQFLAGSSSLPAGTQVVRTQSKGKDWYVLLLGPFADRAAAGDAVAQLPEVIQRNQPWIRSVNSVQATAR